ncbi:MAG: translation initiation factor IF-2 [Alphaproteobacteria bacterium]
MTENTTDQEKKKVLSLSPQAKLELKRATDAAQVRQSFSHGRSKTVTVEVKRSRVVDAPASEQAQQPAKKITLPPVASAPAPKPASSGTLTARQLTDEEREARVRALRDAKLVEETKRLHEDQARPEQEPEIAAPEVQVVEEAAPKVWDAESLRQREIEELRQIKEEEKQKADVAEKLRQENVKKAADRQTENKSGDTQRGDVRSVINARRNLGKENAGQANKNEEEEVVAATPDNKDGLLNRQQPAAGRSFPARTPTVDDEDEDSPRGKKSGRVAAVKAAPSVRKVEKDVGGIRRGRLTISAALSAGDEEAGGRTRSMAAMRRAREKGRRQQVVVEPVKIARDVTIPEFITVQELANRMAVRGADVIKSLMKMGVMATITQSIDGDTAELVATELGHKTRRVAESDVEIGLEGIENQPEQLLLRPPVVTVMGHVDHGKTSLLDAIRRTDVVSREAGGITQHIGAYQVTLEAGGRITFIDTPGHAAFTEMRARGARVTDVVVLVVAANDGIMPQTIEAIAHAKAANVPIIVAINKTDLPDANIQKVRNDLLQHSLVVEELGGDILAVEISAKTGKNITKLEEAILLQAEVLELKANPNRSASGVVVESKLDKGRGPVATVLVQTGTLRVGDIFVTGSEVGKVRALVNDRGEYVQEAGPSMPVEVLGLSGLPSAGDDLRVVDSEARAREVAEFRLRRKKDGINALLARGSVEQMFSAIKSGERKDLPVLIKADVHGSVEAIAGALQKMGDTQKEVRVKVLHTGVGAITESDVTLAKASGGLVVGFNVRANLQAREMARRDGIDIRYYSIIYDILDDVRGMLSGMLAPSLREQFLGYAEIRQVFNITRVGKVGGCMITEGLVKRGAKVRLLRDNVVIHEGMLKTLKRFKDEVKEVREGFECGMAFENYDDIKPGDVIEAFEVVEEARSIEVG